MDLKQLAIELGVSSTTVSRVLSGQGDRYRISKSTQSRIISAAGQNNVVVNQTARSLRLNVSHVIGLIVPDISNPFFATIACQVERSARAQNYSVLLGDSQESIEVEKQIVTLMESRGVDGLVIAPVSGQGEHLLHFNKRDKPQVLVDRVPSKFPGSSVVVDNFAAAREGVVSLHGSGHRAIACLRGNPRSFADKERLRGYQAAMTELALPLKEEWIAGGDYSIQSGREGAAHLLSAQEIPTALLAFGNLLALGALETLRNRGILVPSQMSLISFDDSPWAALLSPPLTTIAQPAAKMGETAVELILQILEGSADEKKTRHRIVLPHSMVLRDSVYPLAEKVE